MAEYDRGTSNADERELKRMQLLLLESMAPADDSTTRPAQTDAYRELPGERLSEVIREFESHRFIMPDDGAHHGPPGVSSDEGKSRDGERGSVSASSSGGAISGSSSESSSESSSSTSDSSPDSSGESRYQSPHFWRRTVLGEELYEGLRTELGKE